MAITGSQDFFHQFAIFIRADLIGWCGIAVPV
jgi:hypothetical protein